MHKQPLTTPALTATVARVHVERKARHLTGRIRATTPPPNRPPTPPPGGAPDHDRTTLEQQKAMHTHACTPPGRIPDKEGKHE